MTTDERTSTMPDTMTTCNACDAAPMAPGQDDPSEPGLCEECLASTMSVGRVEGEALLAAERSNR